MNRTEPEQKQGQDNMQSNRHENKHVYRHEYKLAINLLDYYAIRQRIKEVARLDENAVEGGRYHIRSLYFDNYEDKALREKIYGLPNREKFRLRMYNRNSGFIRLEKKSRSSGLCRKFSAPVTEDGVKAILTGDTGWMKDSGDPLLTELYGKMTYQALKPRVIVDYQREAYIYPYGNVRVTFDSDIRTGLYSTGFFEDEIPMVPVGEQNILLLEVKYDSFLPDIIRDVIQTNTRHAEAFSKYAACRIYG